MRLPWPFGRRRSEGDTPAEAHANGDSGPAGAPPRGGAGAAWRSLPPLVETIGPPPVVAPAAPFAASLAADSPPPPILAPLTHGRGLEAPSGLVVGVAKPVAAAHGSSTQPPVQRSPLRARSPRDTSDLLFEPASGPEPASAPSELSRLPVASDASPAAARSLVRSSATAAGAPPPGLVFTPRAAGSASQDRALHVQRAPATSAAQQPSPYSRPLATPDQKPSRGRTVVSPGVRSSGAEPTRRNVGQVRRLGLGAPIAGGPFGIFDGSAGSPTAAAAPMPLVQRATATPAASPAEPDASAAPDTGTMLRALPGTPGPALPERSPEPAGAATTYGGPAMAAPRSSAAAQGLQRAAGPGDTLPQPAVARTASAREASAPLTSAPPLRAGVQRSALTIPPPTADGAASLPGGAGALPPQTATATAGPVKVHRDQAAGELSRSLDARSFTHGGEIFLPSSHGPLISGTGRSLLAHELTHVTQQRRLGSSLPDERSPRGQALESEAVAAERSGQLPLAASHAGHSHAHGQGEAAPAGKPSGAMASTATGPQRAELPGVPSQPEVEASGTTTIDFSAIQRAPTTPEQPKASPATASRAYSEPELEDLAHLLYGRIGRMLRRELLVDRERAGLAMDIR